MDLAPATSLRAKARKDWGLQNTVGLDPRSTPRPGELTNAMQQQRVRHKIATFVRRAVFPQQLCVPRQYATTREGCFVYKILDGREIDGIREQGVRVVVQENARQARFVMSPLLGSTHDALMWARQQMGAEI